MEGTRSHWAMSCMLGMVAAGEGPAGKEDQLADCERASYCLGTTHSHWATSCVCGMGAEGEGAIATGEGDQLAGHIQMHAECCIMVIA